MIYEVQRASIMKRVSAFILDFVLLTIIATGASYISSLIFDIESHQEKLQEYYDYYEETYNVSFGLTESDFDKMTQEERDHYAEVEEILSKDEKVIREYNLVINLTLIVLFLGVLTGTLLVDLVVPLILKNGQTIGKKVFSLCVIRDNAVKVSNVQLFVRTLIGKFVIGLMIPIYLIIMSMYGIIGIIGPLVLLGLLLLQIIIFSVSKNKTLIHDVLAFTVVVDKESQMIFESEEELLKYKEKVHKESVFSKQY